MERHVSDRRRTITPVRHRQRHQGVVAVSGWPAKYLHARCQRCRELRPRRLPLEKIPDHCNGRDQRRVNGNDKRPVDGDSAFHTGKGMVDQASQELPSCQ